MSTPPVTRTTPEEYLAFERECEWKHEYVDGAVCEMPSAIVIEVMSESSEAYDRGEKFHSYQALKSLNEYVLVSQDEPLVEHYIRDGARTWIYKPTAGLDNSLTLPSIGCTLNLGAVYDKVNFNS